MVEVMLRRGLPREPGGQPWPVVDGPVPIDDARVVAAPSAPPAQAAPAAPAQPAPVEPVTTAPAVAPTAAAAPAPAPATSMANITLRRGLPRTPGGEPWPTQTTVQAAAAPVDNVARHAAPADAPAPVAAEAAASAPAAPVAAPAARRVATTTEKRALRRGLPRVPGGEPWPAAGEVDVVVETVVDEEIAPVTQAPAAAPAAPTEAAAAARTAAPAAPAAPAKPASKADVERKPLLSGIWAKLALGAVVLVAVAGVAVLASRWFLGTETGQSFLEAYPGEYHLPEGAPVGFPAWLGWQHFLNMFLMILIIRSGIMIRKEQRPSAYWTPKGRTDGKVSLTTWFHQSLDVLWLVNGVIFIVMLFVSGQWMRVIPTSWEVFPNALSAALQYMSLNWPTDNGWVNYNGLQQLAYFTTIFIAAPLAAVTGFRMSGLWPKKATGLSKAFPIEVARMIHFPTMIYFTAFIIVHVILVFATGALRNLNHMYAAQGSADPTAYAGNWTGFLFFVASLAVVAGAIAAARPFLLAQVARLFGTVSSR